MLQEKTNNKQKDEEIMDNFALVVDMALFSNLPEDEYNQNISEITKEYDEFETHMYASVNFEDYGIITLKMKDEKTAVTILLDDKKSLTGYFELENPHLFKYIVNRKYEYCPKIVNPCINKTIWKEYRPKLRSVLCDFDNYDEVISEFFIKNLMTKLEEKYGNKLWFSKLKEEYSLYKFHNI